MKALKLYLRQEPEIPKLKRLGWEQIEVSLEQVLDHGLHPVGCCGSDTSSSDHSGIGKKLIELLNTEEYRPTHFMELGYANELFTYSGSGYGYTCDQDDLMRTLETIANGIYFIEELSFQELLEIAKKRVVENWNHELVSSLLTHKFWNFNEQRRFLKSKQPDVIIKCYEDLRNLPLHKIFCLEDFLDQEKSLISHGIPDSVNFRKAKFLDAVTTQNGLLSLKSVLKDFQVKVVEQTSSNGYLHLDYDCHKEGKLIRCIPDLGYKSEQVEEKKKLARRISETIAIDNGKYCFYTSVQNVEQLLENGARISFPTLLYNSKEKMDLDSAEAALSSETVVDAYAVGNVLTDAASCDILREVLRSHNEKVTGTKEELLERIVNLCVDLYKNHKCRLDKFFRQGFIRVSGHSDSSRSKKFDDTLPVIVTNLKDHPEQPTKEISRLTPNMLATYILRHLRGNRIVSPSHENNSYSIEELAEAIVNQKVGLEGVFVQVI